MAKRRRSNYQQNSKVIPNLKKIPNSKKTDEEKKSAATVSNYFTTQINEHPPLCLNKT
jgi:hypothetical protein